MTFEVQTPSAQSIPFDS